MQPGRSCPLHYRYSPQVFAREADFHADTLYVIGGLYGNRPALEAVLELAAREQATLMFNGDFNWFNIDDTAFRAINHEVLQHHASRGNVETEIADDDDDAGCGCAYPDDVSDEDVARSNAISVQLRNTARRHTDLRVRLAALPMHAVAAVGATRVAIVHGDLESLAGWSLAQDRLALGESENIVLNQIITTQCRIVASSHTCLPVARTRDAPGLTQGPCAIINNGAAGMPNFHGTHHGVITRISVRASPRVAPLHALRIGDVHVEALPLHYDHARWVSDFRANWPPGSPAEVSYYRRITQGPAYTPREAYFGGAIPMHASG